ncbi:MAG: peptidylprolyl isomerase [Gammaproteobacteria bacterium]|nr:peptidylprolyl isomerase [Gammaproteobacteria bacterium]
MRTLGLFILMLWSLVTMAASVQALDQVVAEVNDSVVTQHEVDTQMELLSKQLRAKNMPMPADDVLRKQVLQHLIELDLQLQLAKANDISVDATELDATIARIAADNKLSLTQLRQAITQEGMTWETYRESLRKEMVIARLQQRLVGREIEISPQQINDYIKTEVDGDKSNVSFHIQNVVIPLPEAPTSKQLEKAQLKAQQLLKKIKQGEDFTLVAVAESSDEYALEGGDLGGRRLAELPTVFAKPVQKMQIGEVVGPIRTGNGLQLIKLVSMTKNKEHHRITKTHVRHILLKQDVNMTNAEALKQVNNLFEQLKSGKDFAAMAKQYSLDAASAAKGGDLGWVVADELVKPFADAMASLPLNTISKPVKSQYGWHLIEVLARKEVDDSAAYQRQQVRMLLQQRKFNETVQNWKQHVRAQAYVNILDKKLA